MGPSVPNLCSCPLSNPSIPSRPSHPHPVQISFLMAVWLSGCLRSLSLEPGPVLPAPAPAAPCQSPLQASGSEGRQETPSRLNPDVPGYPQPLNSQTCQVCPAPTTFNHFHPAPHLYYLREGLIRPRLNPSLCILLLPLKCWVSGTCYHIRLYVALRIEPSTLCVLGKLFTN